MMSAINPVKVKKILVFTLSNVGDVILNTPVISVLHERFPASRITVLVGPRGEPILKDSRMIHEVIIYDKHISWLKKLSLVFKLRRQRFDLVVDLRNTAIPFLVGAKYRTSLFVNRTAISMRQQHLNRIWPLISFENQKNHFDFYSETEKKSAFQRFKTEFQNGQEKNFIILAPGAGSALKRWTISGFSEVMNYFLAQGKTIVLLGWEPERFLGDELERKAVKSVVNLIGMLSLRESAALISEASLIIANDSAVMHLAHELDRPTVSIFGPTDYQKYGQTGANRRQVRLDLECSPCRAATCRLERRICLDDLPASSVITASEELLNHATHSTLKQP